MRIGQISLAGLALSCAALAQTGYVDSSQCAGCHREIAQSYARTGMGRSFRAVHAGDTLQEFDSGTFEHPTSGQRFTAIKRDGKYYVRRSVAGPDGAAANTLEVRVDYVLGSGDHARSFLRRTAGNRLIEFPVSWYSENGGHWGMSPGYDRAGHQGFSREINYRCMFCHNGYPTIQSEWNSGTEFPAWLPEGIDCQRCHGPGGAHVTAARQGRPARASIVNPARLSPERRLEVCMQCHLETTSAPLPGAMLRDGRGVFSYKPGEPLENYVLYFDHAPGTGHDEKFEIVSSVYRLRKSACFQASNGRLGCTKCHDPHRASSRAEMLLKTSLVCRECHGAEIAKRSADGRHPVAQDCGSCHMPQRRADDAVHILITDHRIGLPEQDILGTAESHEGSAVPYAGEVIAYYPRDPPRLYLARAQVGDLANLPYGLRRLEQAITYDKPVSARPYFELGEAFLTAGDARRAAPFLEGAVNREPREWRYEYKLAQALHSSSQIGRGVDAYQHALTLAPREINVLNGLGSAFADQGKTTEAIALFRRALAGDPEDAQTQSTLGSVLLRAGDRIAAERALREAVRLRPEQATMRISLGAALVGVGRYSDARFELEQAIKAGPSNEVARSAWFAALAENGDLKDAQRQYEASRESQLAPAHANLGTVLVALGDPDAAIREYRLAIVADPKSAPTLLNLALTLADRGATVEARKRLEDALRIAPNLFAAHLKLGEILQATGEPDTAAQHFRRAAESPDARIRQAATERLRRR